MTKVSPFLEYVLHNAMADIPDITYKRMFGGYGLYKNGTFFAIIAYDELYFKVDDQTKHKYEEMGSSPFIYEGKSKPVSMSYWEVPESILEDPELLKQWVNEACRAYMRSKKK